MRASVLLIVTLAAALAIGTILSGKKSPAKNSADDIASLRQEVAELRAEVDELRNADQARKSRSSSGKFLTADGALSAPEETLAELRAQQQATQSLLISNFQEITLDRGSDAWARGDYKKAMKLLLPLAESGNAVAQHRIGVMYVLGQGVEKDPAKAIEWYGKAAEQGQAESQHGLGLRLLWGDGTDKDPAKAAAWFTAAANQGVMDSAPWLGDMYWNGNGVAQDRVEAYKWLLLSKDKFFINHRNGTTLEQFSAQLTPEEIAEAQKRADAFAPQRTGPEDF